MQFSHLLSIEKDNQSQLSLFFKELKYMNIGIGKYEKYYPFYELKNMKILIRKHENRVK